MKKARRPQRLLLAAALAALLQLPAHAGDGEGALHAAVQNALWPADIVRAAQRYLQAHADAPAAAEVAQVLQQALRTAQFLGRSDLRLYRSAFVGDAAPAEVRAAALGDAEAALRLAHRERTLAGTTPHYVGWLQYAALLGHAAASYELALHFRVADQPILAARYESIALAQGYVPAPALDNVRK